MFKEKNEEGLTAIQKSKLNLLFNQMNGKDKDLFKFVNLENNTHATSVYSKLVKNDIKRNMLVKGIHNLSLLVGMKAVSGVDYILCLLKRIDLAKQLFVLDIEEGTEVFIPKELRTDNFPLSFQFNDPILMIIHRKMSDDRKEYFIKKN